ncbi:hypothetical protein JHY03_70860 (plasmid) [Streptomyces sp. CA-256286]|nr:hypothetical protein JHY03_70860 [Streptomyces sp. CA-256286]
MRDAPRSTPSPASGRHSATPSTTSFRPPTGAGAIPEGRILEDRRRHPGSGVPRGRGTREHSTAPGSPPGTPRRPQRAHRGRTRRTTRRRPRNTPRSGRPPHDRPHWSRARGVWCFRRPGTRRVRRGRGRPAARGVGGSGRARTAIHDRGPHRLHVREPAARQRLPQGGVPRSAWPESQASGTSPPRPSSLRSSPPPPARSAGPSTTRTKDRNSSESWRCAADTSRPTSRRSWRKRPSRTGCVRGARGRRGDHLRATAARPTRRPGGAPFRRSSRGRTETYSPARSDSP